MKQPVRNTPTGLLVGLAALILAVGGATAWWTYQTSQPNPETITPVQPTSPSSPDPVVEKKAEVYWLQPNNDAIKLAPSPLTNNSAGKPNEVLAAAIANLLAGPSDPAVTTTIPKGTKLNALDVKADGIHIDLSEEFTFGGGSTSMQGRVAQVLYTATSLDPQAKVWLSVGGEPLEELGGEGLILEQPLSRQSFEQDFSL